MNEFGATAPARRRNALPLFEIALVLGRLDHGAGSIVNANQGIA